VQRIFGNHRAGLAQAVAFDERHFEFFLELAQRLHRQRRGTADENADRQRGWQLRAENHPVKRWHGGQDRRMARKNFLQHRARRMQRFHKHNRTAGSERQKNPDGHHIRVKHRQNHGETIVRHGFQHDAAAIDVVEQIAVRKHRALWFARRAGSVNDDGQILFGARAIYDL